jgi:hypothetical protein
MWDVAAGQQPVEARQHDVAECRRAFRFATSATAVDATSQSFVG